MEDSKEVDSLADSLSEQDFDRVGGASGREGLRRTAPSTEKYPLPCSVVGASPEFSLDEFTHGVESSCAAIVISILASPPITYVSGE